MNTFAFDLYGRLAAASDENVFLSPASISTALAMTYAGARENTASQMDAVLHLPERDVHEGFGAMVDHLNALGEQEKFDLTMANALWGQRDYAFRPQFTELLDARYGAGLRLVDFRGETEAARVAINDWVEEQTNEKIEDLIPPGVLTPLTRLVLTNAIYFQGTWEHQFNSDSTRPMPFTTAAGNEVETPTMFQEARFRYAEDETAQCLEMGYQGADMAMTILLPKQKDGLADLEKDLDAAALRQWTERLKAQKVKVYLPKFTMTTEFQLSGVLAAMGMPDAFRPKQADLSGMDGTKKLFIHEVVHKAFVDVDETGTEAAAATGVIVGITSVPPPMPVFRADHPFLFLIGDTRSGAVLFVGRLHEPKP
ncbi:MAG: serpin family protein [Thermoguttaceae bacterium]